MGSLWKPHWRDPPEAGQMPGSDFCVWLHEGVVLIRLTACVHSPVHSSWEGITCGTNQPFSFSFVIPIRCGNKLGREVRAAVLYVYVHRCYGLVGPRETPTKMLPKSTQVFFPEGTCFPGERDSPDLEFQERKALLTFLLV